MLKCSIANKSAERVNSARLKFKHSNSVLEAIKTQGGQKDFKLPVRNRVIDIFI